MDGRSNNECDFRDIRENSLCCGFALDPAQEPPLSSHLVSQRRFYSHHGIYVGNGRVIHYAGFVRGLRRGPVEEVSLEQFARGRSICVRSDTPRFEQGEVAARARSRLGECSYRFLTNNCEHFCAWALRGESRSRQVERLCAPARVVWNALCSWLAMSTGQRQSDLHTGNDWGTGRLDI
jgi:hypothetical protein